MRLSSLDLRKKMCGVKDDSSTLTDQRKTLVELLSSLFKAKEQRDRELDTVVSQLAGRKCKDAEDFWLLQYQSLMNMKPTVLADAENNLDPQVKEILTLANALYLMPVFAKNDITYHKMLQMSEADYSELSIGAATYQSIQRAFHNYLAAAKLSSTAEPSAPEEEIEASAPPIEGASSMPEDEASAPPLEESFFEPECVICMSKDCKVLFIPCGHICVCIDCCTNVDSCPLCRAVIVNKFCIHSQ